MDMSKILQIGDHISVVYRDETYKTSIQDVLPGNKFLVSEPTVKALPVRIPNKAILGVIYIRPDCSYRFQVEMNGLYISKKVRMIRLLMRTEPVRSQRRAYYRLPVELVLNVNVTLSEDDGLSEITFSTSTVDISEGGLSFVSGGIIGEGTRIAVEPIIPSGESYEMNAEVVRCSYPAEPEQPYIISVKYVDCPDFIQRNLAKFIMAEQIRRRRIR